MKSKKELDSQNLDIIDSMADYDSKTKIKKMTTNNKKMYKGI